MSALAVPDDYIAGRILSHDAVVDKKTGELLATANDEINDDILGKLLQRPASPASAPCG